MDRINNSSITAEQQRSFIYCNHFQTSVRSFTHLKCKKTFYVHFAVVFYVSSELVPRIGFLRASIVIHSELLTSILHLPMTFFWVNPTGRLLSRFSKDIDIVDDRLPHNFDSLSFFTFQVNS